MQFLDCALVGGFAEFTPGWRVANNAVLCAHALCNCLHPANIAGSGHVTRASASTRKFLGRRGDRVRHFGLISLPVRRYRADHYCEQVRGGDS